METTKFDTKVENGRMRIMPSEHRRAPDTPMPESPEKTAVRGASKSTGFLIGMSVALGKANATLEEIAKMGTPKESPEKADKKDKTLPNLNKEFSTARQYKYSRAVKGVNAEGQSNVVNPRAVSISDEDDDDELWGNGEEDKVLARMIAEGAMDNKTFKGLEKRFKNINRLQDMKLKALLIPLSILLGVGFVFKLPGAIQLRLGKIIWTALELRLRFLANRIRAKRAKHLKKQNAEALKKAVGKARASADDVAKKFINDNAEEALEKAKKNLGPNATRKQLNAEMNKILQEGAEKAYRKAAEEALDEAIEEAAKKAKSLGHEFTEKMAKNMRKKGLSNIKFPGSLKGVINRSAGTALSAGGFLNFGEKVGKGVKGVAKSIYNSEKVLGGVSLSDMVKGAREGAASTVDFMKGIGKDIVDDVAGIADNAVKWAKNTGAGKWVTGKMDEAAKMITLIKNWITGAKNVAKEVADDVSKAFSLFKKGVIKFKGFADVVLNAGRRVLDVLFAPFKYLAGKILQPLGKLFNKFAGPTMKFLKGAGKTIPYLGAAINFLFAIDRAMRGDWKHAGMEVAAGVLDLVGSTISLTGVLAPIGLGIKAVSLLINADLMAYDIFDAEAKEYEAKDGLWAWLTKGMDAGAAEADKIDADKIANEQESEESQGDTGGGHANVEAELSQIIENEIDSVESMIAENAPAEDDSEGTDYTESMSGDMSGISKELRGTANNSTNSQTAGQDGRSDFVSNPVPLPQETVPLAPVTLPAPDISDALPVVEKGTTSNISQDDSRPPAVSRSPVATARRGVGSPVVQRSHSSRGHSQPKAPRVITIHNDPVINETTEYIVIPKDDIQFYFNKVS